NQEFIGLCPQKTHSASCASDWPPPTKFASGPMVRSKNRKLLTIAPYNQKKTDCFVNAFSAQPATGNATAVNTNESVIRASFVSAAVRSEEHTSELQSRFDLVCRLLLEKKITLITLYT